MKKVVSVLSLVLGLGLLSAQETAPKKSSLPPPPPPPKEARMQTAKHTASPEKMVAKPAKSNSGVMLKKDGTPDKRYKANQHLKKDGTPDKRYKK